MVHDLDIPVRLAVQPTVRDPDGLALSSRNGRLTPQERERALGLPRALRAAADAVARGETDAEALRSAALAAMDGLEPEYVAVVDADSFAPVRNADGRVIVAVAARIGPTRLIDNAIVGPAATPGGAPTA
jgi:pantoate--beta-alanine ligase